MTDPVIRLENLEKKFGSVHALDGLTLAVPSGPVGLLGPNGAGKTTLIKLLLGLLRADSGVALIAGFNPSRVGERLKLRCQVGYMPEGDCLLPRTSAVSLVATLGRITGLTWEDAMTRAHEALDYVGLEEARYREVREYSTGMKQRLKLAQALVHDPPILLLDEPTNGLDPKGRRHMLDLVYDLGHVQGKNILLCSHLLPDVERTCQHVIVLHKGKKMAGGSIEELTKTDGRAIKVRVAGRDAEFTKALARAGRSFELGEDGVYRVTGSPTESAEHDDADEIFALAAQTETVVEFVDVERSSLDEVFLKLLQESEGE